MTSSHEGHRRSIKIDRYKNDTKIFQNGSRRQIFLMKTRRKTFTLLMSKKITKTLLKDARMKI